MLILSFHLNFLQFFNSSHFRGSTLFLVTLFKIHIAHQLLLIIHLQPWLISWVLIFSFQWSARELHKDALV